MTQGFLYLVCRNTVTDCSTGLFMGYIIIFLAFAFSCLSVAVEPNTIEHYQHQSRYHFGRQVLDLALSKIDTPYTVVDEDKQQVNEARGEWQVISGKLDLQWMSTSKQREEKMIPVKIPIYRGILGLRLLLVARESQQPMKEVRTLKDLSHFVGGHGAHWGDLPVYEANGLPVKVYGDYETLFRQLIDKRFDYFHRGVNEIWKEVIKYPDTLRVADDIMLFYPLAVYFFVSKSRPELANNIEKGLTRALNDGSFKSIFLKYHQSYIDKAKLNNRNLIVLKNPVNPKSMLAPDTSWWMPARFLPQI